MSRSTSPSALTLRRYDFAEVFKTSRAWRGRTTVVVQGRNCAELAPAAT
jgi:hypothetical protein